MSRFEIAGQGTLSQSCARLDEPLTDEVFYEIYIVIQSRYDYY